MSDEMIKTGVDDLIAFLEGKDRVALIDAATALKVNPETLQAWVDFLIEENILGIEYKFTKPFIYLNKGEKGKAKIIGEEELTWESYRRAFLQKAKEKMITEQKAIALWRSHVVTSLEAKRPFFFDEARKRSISDIEGAWSAYKRGVLAKI